MRAIDLIARARVNLRRRLRRVRRGIADRGQVMLGRVSEWLQRDRADDGVDYNGARRERERVAREVMIDEAGEESFPASDPPSWTNRGTC